MNNNWTKAISKINKERYQIPAGWDTKEQVAESLKCAAMRVHELLKPGVACGDVDRQEFQIWDDVRNQVARVTCYRVTADHKVAKAKTRMIEDLVIQKVQALAAPIAVGKASGKSPA